MPVHSLIQNEEIKNVQIWCCKHYYLLKLEAFSWICLLTGGPLLYPTDAGCKIQ